MEAHGDENGHREALLGVVAPRRAAMWERAPLHHLVSSDMSCASSTLSSPLLTVNPPL